jgi:hypothetical protein
MLLRLADVFLHQKVLVPGLGRPTIRGFVCTPCRRAWTSRSPCWGLSYPPSRLERTRRPWAYPCPFLLSFSLGHDHRPSYLKGRHTPRRAEGRGGRGGGGVRSVRPWRLAHIDTISNLMDLLRCDGERTSFMAHGELQGRWGVRITWCSEQLAQPDTTEPVRRAPA